MSKLNITEIRFSKSNIFIRNKPPFFLVSPKFPHSPFYASSLCSQLLCRNPSSPKMLAIFAKSVASTPDTFKKPHNKSVSALDDGFLVKHFFELYPDSDVNYVGDSAVFAHSRVTPHEKLGYQYCGKGDTFCIFHGDIGDDFDTLAEKYTLYSEYDNEASVIYEAFKILQEQNYQTPHHVVRDLYGDFSFIYYDDSSKLLFFTNGKPTGARLYWGLDSDSSVVITDDRILAVKACAGGALPFPKGQVYVSCRGRVGLDALFGDYTAEAAEQKAQNAGAKKGSPKLFLNDDTLGPHVEAWRPPPRAEVFKVNTQGVVFPKEKIIGIGVIIRNSNGEMILAGSKKITGYNSQPLAHELASVEGLILALKAGFREVIWESCSHGLEDCAYQQVLISYAQLLGEKFRSIQTSKIPKGANKAAYGLAEYAKTIEDCLVWIREIPGCIASYVEMESSDPQRVGLVPA